MLTIAEAMGPALDRLVTTNLVPSSSVTTPVEEHSLDRFSSDALAAQELIEKACQEKELHQEDTTTPVESAQSDSENETISYSEPVEGISAEVEPPKRPPQVITIMSAVTSKLTYYESMQFLKDYARFEHSLVKGTMDYAKVLGIRRPNDFLQMLTSLTELIQEREFPDRLVYQFKLPDQYRAYSPWIQADELYRRRVEIPKEIEQPFKIMTTSYRLLPNGKSGIIILETDELLPMTTRIVTFTIMKESGIVRWFAGDEPSVSIHGPYQWIRLLGYRQSKNHHKKVANVYKPITTSRQRGSTIEDRLTHSELAALSQVINVGES